MVTSASAAAARSVVALSRSCESMTRSWSPGSSTGARPSFSRLTASGLTSIPTTSLPLLARTAASGAPSFPSPTTAIGMTLLRGLRADEEVPTEAVLERPEERLRHPAEVRLLHVPVLDVVANPVREDVIDPNVLRPEAAALDELT